MNYTVKVKIGKNYLLYRLRSFSNLFLSKIQFGLVGFSFLLELKNQ